MIPIKDAVTNAIAFAKSVLDPERTKDMQLEEVERSESGSRDVWNITLSMLKPESPLQSLSRGTASLLGPPQGPREYKIFAVDASSGEVLSMKIRELAGAE
jgi:hypothetical protein